MSFSKIYKDTGIEQAQPFVLESLRECEVEGDKTAVADERPGEGDVGDKIFAIEKEAYEKGFMAGESAGFEFGRQKAEIAFNGLEKILKELSVFKETLFASCEKEMVELAMAISKKVIRREVDTKRDGVLDCVRIAMKAVVAAGEVIIRVNTKDCGIVGQYSEELARYGKGVKGVVVLGDDSIGRGGCVVETNYGEVDATLDSVMSEIEEKLKNAS